MKIITINDKKINMNKWWIAIFISVFLFFIFVFLKVIFSPPTISRSQLWVEPVQAGDLTITLNGNGELVPSDLFSLVSETGGNVLKVHALPGTRLNKGDIIVTLVNTELIRQKSVAEKALAERKAENAGLSADLAMQKIDLDARSDDLNGKLLSARLEMDAYSKLLEQNIVSRIQYEKLKLSVKALESELNQSKERLKQFEVASKARLFAASLAESRLAGDVKDLHRRVVDLDIRAEEYGVLHQLGVGVTEGSPLKAGAIIAKIARSEKLRAEIKVPAARLAELRLGQSVKLSLRGENIIGHVDRIDPRVDQDQVLVTAILPDVLPASAQAGLPVMAEVQTELMSNVIYLMKPVGAENNLKMSLFALDSDGETLSKREVQFGKIGGKYILVESGLTAGEHIVLSDMHEYVEESTLLISDTGHKEILDVKGG